MRRATPEQRRYLLYEWQQHWNGDALKRSGNAETDLTVVQMDSFTATYAGDRNFSA